MALRYKAFQSISLTVVLPMLFCLEVVANCSSLSEVVYIRFVLLVIFLWTVLLLFTSSKIEYREANCDSPFVAPLIAALQDYERSY